MSLADFFTFNQPPREHQYVFRANEQPDLGRDGLRLLLIGASVPGKIIVPLCSEGRKAASQFFTPFEAKPRWSGSTTNAGRF